jgi:hypothetical protein
MTKKSIQANLVFLTMIAVSVFVGYGLSEQSVEAASGGTKVTGKVNPNLSVTVNNASVLLQGLAGNVVNATSAVIVNVKSNVNYNLTVKAAADLTDATTGATVPIGQLAWSNSGTGTWTPFSITDATLDSNAPAAVGAGKDYTFDYQLSIPNTAAVGNYDADIIYTAIQL